MEPRSHVHSEASPANERVIEPLPWVRQMIAVLLRLGLGITLLDGGLLGYVMARRGGQASGLGWTTLLGPAAVAGVLENDLLVPFVQIAIGLALILGFFTVVSAILAGFLILSGPIFQFLAILSSSGPATNSALMMQALVTTGSINLLLLVAAVLWLTPIEGTSWSLDALIFAHRRHRRPAGPNVAAVAVAGAESDRATPTGPAPIDVTRGE
jgi:hypothetical protein